ncbi:Maf family nucleotide pyrophosphatase [Alcaligenaceae bacterium CGII-47]|nr:Maf family nucleotide pyrophosphatase [Alcaligenaceae bacterium CGII-47]
MPTPFIYLASASPRRHALLEQIGVPHEVLHIPAPAGEDEPQWAAERPEAYVLRTAIEKAQRAAVWLQTPSSDRPKLRIAPILCADTTVILEDKVLGKPADLDEARDTLIRLSGREHTVHTAIALACGNQIIQDVSITLVRFKRLSLTEIAEYCATGEPLGKAGSYAIQGRAGAFVTHLSGSYTGVMGLPVYETARLIEQGISLNTSTTP